MDGTTDEFTIGRLAHAAQVGAETIRTYQRRGLMREPAKPYGGIRRYGPKDLERLRFIRSAQSLGLNLKEVAELLRLDDGTHCDQARHLAEEKLREIRGKLSGLKRMERALSELVDRCQQRRGDIHCPLIDSLHEGLKQ